MFDLRKARQAISEENLAGWLFFGFRHRDSISDRILEIPSQTHNTRPWVYLVPRQRQPVKLVHAIEEKILDPLPGTKRVYASRDSFRQALQSLSAAGARVAAQFSPEVPVLSFLDHGSAQLLAACGFELVSSAPLIQRFLGVLDDAGIESHETAARLLYAIVGEVWERVRRRFADGTPPAEGEVQEWILELFRRHELETDLPPVVAAGRNTADPHYMPQGGGEAFRPGQVVQLDIWARLRRPGAVYADISWVGFLGPQADPAVRAVFEALVAARDLAARRIAERLESGAEIRGQDVDREVRAFLESRGYGPGLKHRTGHAIDAELHGYGVNLDATEFPDPRRILEGSCFSIEPGIYLQEYGLRTEIDAYVRSGRLVVSGGTPQRDILCVY